MDWPYLYVNRVVGVALSRRERAAGAMADEWHYLDRSGQEYGPFSSRKMPAP